MMFAFALSGLVTGLIRPEGVILASLMLLAVIVMRGFRNSISIIGTFGVTFLLLGGAYCLWRWDYFGYPLPNPFYKKGDSGLHWDSLKYSLLNTLRLCLPMAFAVIFAFRSHETTKRALAYLIPILGFASAFVLISDEMNYGARFQYALLPIVLMSWTPFVYSAGRVGLDAFTSPYREVPEGGDPLRRNQLSVRGRSVFYIALIAFLRVLSLPVSKLFLTSFNDL